MNNILPCVLNVKVANPWALFKKKKKELLLL